MQSKIAYSPRALKDLDEIWDYRDYFFQKIELTEKNDLSSTLVPDTNVVKIAST